MDKFFPSHHDIPTIPMDQLDRMTEVALSYRQQVPGNENSKSRAWSGWWAGAFSTAACAALVIGVLTLQDITPAATTVAASDDAYSDITEIAILNTLDGY